MDSDLAPADRVVESQPNLIVVEGLYPRAIGCAQGSDFQRADEGA
jgi:hypothetical protein